MYKNKLTHEFYYNTERNKVYMVPNKLQVLLYCLGSLHSPYLTTPIPQKRINIKPAGSTRSSNHHTLLHPSTISSLKIANRSYNRTAPIPWNNLPKSMRTFSNTSPNSATTSQCSSLPLSLSKNQFCSHHKTYLSASRTHLNLLSCSNWPHRSLP